MAEVQERAVLSADNYAEVVSMLKSNDDASVQMALTIMEQANFEDSQVYILCALKETFDKVFKNTEKFEKEYPVLHKSVTEKLLETESQLATLSFKRIFELATARKNKEEVEFMLRIFKDELVRLLTDYGFSFLEYLDIEIKPKNNPYV